MQKWFPGRALNYSAMHGHFAILTLLKMIKNGQFSILSFFNDIVRPINLINAVIINYQLSIEGNALEFTVAIQLVKSMMNKVCLCLS